MSENNSRIRVAYFVTALETGGTERSLVQLLSVLPDSRYEKHVICLSGFGPLENDARAVGAILHDLQYPRLRVRGKVQWKRLPAIARPLPRLVKILRSIRPDILHTMIPVCNVLGGLAARLAGVSCKVCSKLSLGVYRDKNWVLARLEDQVDPSFDLIHCKSQGIVDDLIAREPVDVGRTRIIYNGLELGQYGSSIGNGNNLREQLGFPNSVPVIGMVANLNTYKGHADMIEATSYLTRDFPNLRLLIIGRDDGIQHDLTEKARRLGIERNLVFIGERRDIPELLRTMTLLVSASHEEGFSNVILEAMASELPVVATKVGGNPEAVVDMETGFLVPPHSPKELARAIRPLLEDPALCRMMGQAGRKRAAAKFSREAMGRAMENFYAEALDSSR